MLLFEFNILIVMNVECMDLMTRANLSLIHVANIINSSVRSSSKRESDGVKEDGGKSCGWVG